MKKDHRDDVTRQTLVGKKIVVVEAKNPTNLSKEGIVRKETRNTIVLDDGKTLLKNQVVIEVHHNNTKTKIDGIKIMRKIEEKLKIK